MDWHFEMTIPSTGDEVLVEYEYVEADPSVGLSEGFDYSLSNDEGEIMYALTEEDYEEITNTIQAHFELQRQADADEAAIARWESNND